MVYLLCFIWTPLFTYLAEKLFKKNKKCSGSILMFLAILIPSLVAGLRSLDVGRDVGSYVTPAIKSALTMDFGSYMKSRINLDGYLENGYRILIYIFTRISSSPNFSLFMLQFLTMLFVALFAYKNRDKMRMPVVMITYMLIWYCISFTFMRQSLAIAIILYSTTYFEEKKYIKTLLLFLLAISIHTISYVSIIIYGLMYVSKSNMSNKRKKFIYFLYFTILVVGTLFFEQIVYFLTNVVKILPDKYYNYTQFYTADEKYNQLSDLVMKIFFIICTLFYMKFADKTKSRIDASVILLLLLTDFAYFLISYKIVNAGRIGLYFYYLGLFYLIPNINKIFKDISTSRFIISCSLVIVMFGVWVWKFPIRKWSETYPYRSNIITSLH